MLFSSLYLSHALLPGENLVDAAVEVIFLIPILTRRAMNCNRLTREWAVNDL
jgi:hypothetical protein